MAGVQDAIRYADYWLEVHHEHRSVWVRKGLDRFGRSDVVYVRPVNDVEMSALQTAGLVTLAYTTRG